MHWYGGSISEAVNLSKQRNAIFVVFVEGDNELSAEMAATIDDSAVVTRLSDQGNFLAVKLKSGSTNYTHFAQIYQFVPVPSLFFIGRNGTPLEVVCAGVQPDNLATRIDRILEEHFKDKQPSPTPGGVQPSTSAQNLRERTVNFLQAEAAAAAQPAEEPAKTVAGPALDSSPPAKVAKLDPKQSPESDVVCVGDVCFRRPRPAPDQPGPSQAPTPSLQTPTPTPTPAPNATPEQELLVGIPTSESTASIEEKMERAKELIEARRREKADKEKEQDKEKELDRRAAGKGVAELKRWQADQELKQIQEERKREKMENNLARQRILEQIAQDRLERRARDLPPPSQPQHSLQAPATSGDGGCGARIQFKLPDGSSHTAHFSADGTLADVQRYVADNLQLSTSSFSLWTAFPRRELSEPSRSLRGLQLAPSAALLVLPRRAAPLVPRSGPIASIITFFTQMFATMILEPSQQLYAWVRSRLFPPAGRSTGAAGPAPPAPPGPAPAPPGPARAPAPPAAPPSPALRRRGNIHRLPSDRAPDDDNNTWNGNSTQQM
ncbi:UBX domain-containing protein 4 [Trichoplusia ni]|uniref:UBX domain-containing protein 4 n=1 Tax=Trichoplusia ni TaxID=7111 RepID=A0A7E5WNQ9_TRINI|nr:UBX domain-containing protein 4 [Trichoplusia ni]